MVEELRAAGVDNALTIRVFECVETEHAQAIVKAARLFYNIPGDDGPITLGQFVDELNNMRRRMWGIVSAVGDIVGNHDDSVGPGVLQLVEDAAREMDRLAEAFDAERLLAREQEAQS